MQPARSPVACATNGDLFCRECAINDLLAQRQEIKRLEREREEARKRLAEDEERALEDARRRELREFELVSMGLEAAKKDGNGGGDNQRKRKAEETEEALAAFKAREIEVDGKRKKIFELDEKEMARIAREEQERLKRELKREKVFSFFSWNLDSWLTGSCSRSRANPRSPHSGSPRSHHRPIPTKSPRTRPSS
jgi:nitric oxide synthase-interacting protein